MQQLAPEYLTEIARQIGGLSAFLGGFAAAFLGTLLAINGPRRVAGWAIVSAALAALSFIVTVVACTMLVMVLHPQAPANVVGQGNGFARVLGFLGFMLGTYALLFSIGASGWLRSRRAGLVTSWLAGIAGLLVTGLVLST